MDWGDQVKVLNQKITDKFAAYHGDCVDVVSALPDESIGYSVFSPPFSSLYVYSNSERDMGNSRTHGDFHEHFRYLVKQLYRVLKTGRLISFHCMPVELSMNVHGVHGLYDLRSHLLRTFEEEGFVFASETTIWKNPVCQMQRTKAHGLLYKTFRLRANMSRQGMADYLVTVRKPGDIKAENRVLHDPEVFDLDLWQKWASPVWMDINPSDTLQHKSAREHDDEKHVCPLQLEVARRGIQLWSNPGDVVLSPFMGIGSEGYVALEQGRRFVGAELKASYYRQAVANLTTACDVQAELFA